MKRKKPESPESAARRLLTRVKALAKEGRTQAELAKALGLKSIVTLHSRLLKASQLTGKPIPPLKMAREAKGTRPVEVVEVRRRGKGESYGVNIPQEPLARAGFGAGAKLQVTVRGRAIFLRAAVPNQTA